MSPEHWKSTSHHFRLDFTLLAGHSSVLQNGISERSQFQPSPRCKTDPQSPIVGTLVSRNQPRPTSRGGHLKGTPQSQMTELQRRGQ